MRKSKSFTRYGIDSQKYHTLGCFTNPGPATTTTQAFVGGGSPMLVGTTSAGTVAFFGSAAVAQPAASAYAAVATTAVINSSTSATCFGFTSAQATALITLANGIRAMGVTLGLWST